MDSLQNYNQALMGFAQQKATEEAKIAGVEKEEDEKTKQFTNPFEQTGIDSLVDLFKQGSKGVGKNVLSKLGITNEKAKQYKDAFQKNGTKGVINQLNNDKNLVKENVLDKVKSVIPSAPSAEDQAVTGASKVTEREVEDLLPQEFEKTEGVIKQGLRSRISGLSGDQQKEFTDKIGKRYVKDLDEFGGDRKLANQYNLNQASRTLDEVSGEKPAFSIQSLSKSEYSDPIVRDALVSAVKTERDELHPLYRNKFNSLMNERLAKPEDIADNVLREKFNVHQASRTIDELKTLEPKDLIGDAGKARTLVSKGETKLVSQLGRTGEDELGQGIKSITSVFSKTAGAVAEGALGQAGNIAQLATGGFHKKNILSIAKNEAVSQAQDKAVDLASELAKASSVGKEEAKQVAKGVGKEALKEGAEEEGEISAEGGGEEDPIGDVLGLVVGLGSYLGGIFAKHKKPSLPQISNASFQIGA